MRVKRGTLPSTREGGRLYVLLHTEPTTDPHRPHDREYDRTDELISTLREQLEAERRAHAEARRIIAGLVERVPAIEAPSDERALQGGPEPQPVAPGAQEGVPRTWWEETLKTTLPTVIAPLVTAAVAGFGSIFAAAEGATILAVAGFVISVITAVMAAYFGIRLLVERRQTRLAMVAASEAARKAAETAQRAAQRAHEEALSAELDAQDETREGS